MPAGTPPLGFTYSDGAYHVHEPTMRTVRRIFQLSASGESLHRIRKTLEAEGIRTTGNAIKPEGSNFWNVNTIRRIITRDEYRSHGPDEIKSLVATGQLTGAVAATLDPDKSYGISWYNRHATYAPNGKRRRGAEKPRAEWIAVPVPDAGVPREHGETARANMGGSRPSRADSRFWELSGHLFCSCGCKLVSRAAHKASKKYYYYVCSRLVRDGRDACPDGKWFNAANLELEVYWALRNIQPQDLDAQIQTLIDRDRSPEVEIKAAHATLEDVARQRAKFQTMAARDLLTLDELEVHIARLDTRRRAAVRQIGALQTTSERVKRLRLMQQNPILAFVGQTEEMRKDYYRDLELRVIADKGGVEICGVFGSQNVAPTWTWATTT